MNPNPLTPQPLYCTKHPEWPALASDGDRLMCGTCLEESRRAVPQQQQPLSPERRRKIEKKFGFWDCACTDERDAEKCLRCQFRELFDDSEYWRLAVKNSAASPILDIGRCQWCMASPEARHVEPCFQTFEITHKPDCPWKLAQL